MFIRSLQHAALLVTDVERSREFYKRVLGMEESPRPATFGFPGAWLHAGTAELHLIGEFEAGRVAALHTRYRPDELATGYVTHLAFEVDDLAATERQLRALDIEIVGGPRPRGDGVQQLYICDPDGYVIEFFDFPAPAPDGI